MSEIRISDHPVKTVSSVFANGVRIASCDYTFMNDSCGCVVLLENENEESNV